MSSFSINTSTTEVIHQTGQWNLRIDMESGKVTDSNLQVAVTGPKKGEEILAFYSFSKAPGENYGAGKFVQEPSLAYPVTVREPAMNEGKFQFDEAGEMITTEVSKRLVGFILLDESGDRIIGRGSWSNLAVFAKKDYEFTPATGVLRIEEDYYRITQATEADKNRLDGIAGTFIKINPSEKKSSLDQPVVCFELGLVASILIPTNADQIKALKSLRQI